MPLYLVPVPLGEGGNWQLSSEHLEIIQQVTIFIAENAKTARRFLKQCNMPVPISELTIMELNEHTPVQDVPAMLDAAAKEGKDIALLSEAGCPCVADPGAEAVRLAHLFGVEVVPWVGPSSILLALMASGLSGQHFAFNGYLPVDAAQRKKALQQLEHLCRRQQQTQIFIETPYRNESLLRDMLATLSADIRLCVAVDLTLPTQWICTKTIAEWKKTETTNIHKRPCIFVIG